MADLDDVRPKTASRRFMDEYLVGEKLGAGQYAEVHRCTHKATGSVHAVKVVGKQKASTQQVGDVLREVAILQRVDHPNCLRVLDFYDEEAALYIVMEIVIGGELFGRIVKVKHFSEKVAAAYTRQILAGVSYLHSVGVVHRDLKPENLLIVNNGGDVTPEELDRAEPVKIVDFGFADVCKGPTLTKCCGTPLYIAPEVLHAGLFKNGPPYGVSADMWSVGVIVYILLSGAPPFCARTQADQFKLVVAGQYTYPEKRGWNNVSADARDFIDRLLVLDPRRRMTAQEALNHPWLLTTVDVELPETIANLREFNASKVWRRGVFGVEAINRMLYLQRCTEQDIKPNAAIEQLLLEAAEPVTEINLINNYVGAKGLMALLDVVEQSTTITDLLIGNNGANNTVVERLCEVARKHPSLQRINLDNNLLSHMAGQALLSLITANPRIVGLSLVGVELQPSMVTRIDAQLVKNRGASP